MLNENKQECHKNNTLAFNYIQPHSLNSTKIKFNIKNTEIRILAKLSISDQILELTVDTGAQISILKPNKLHGNTKVAVHEKIKIIGIAKTAFLTSIGKVNSSIYINEIGFKHDFQIINDNFNLVTDGIIGNDFLIKYGANIDYKEQTIQLQIPSNYVMVEKKTTNYDTV